MHLVFLLEEPSAEAFIENLLPKVLPAETTWNSIVFQGKAGLLTNLEARLKGYRQWIPADWRIIVVVDEDRTDCRVLKERLEGAAINAGFATKSRRTSAGQFVVLNRIVVEELESWFFGDVPALAKAFPGVSPNLSSQAKYRNPDAIAGGTWEALELLLRRAGYYQAGMPKIEVARTMAVHMEPSRNTSTSFNHFMSGLAALN